MQSADLRPPSLRQKLLALATAGSLGALAYMVAVALTVFTAPRQDEGV
jgi:hypothetical protein